MSNTWLTIIAAFLLVSCPIAQAASGSRTAFWIWGLLGPIGWIIAAIRGSQERADDLVDAIDDLTKASRRSPPPR